MSTVRERAARALSHTALALHPNPGPQRDAMVREALDAVLAVVANVGEIAAVLAAHPIERVPEIDGGRGELTCPTDGWVGVEDDVIGHIAEAVVAHILDAS